MSERDDLVEQVAGAARPRPRDELRYHPAWHDLDAEGRTRAFELAKALRTVEAALDPDGMSTTMRHFLGGLLAGSRELSLFIASNINSVLSGTTMTGRNTESAVCRVRRLIVPARASSTSL